MTEASGKNIEAAGLCPTAHRFSSAGLGFLSPISCVWTYSCFLFVVIVVNTIIVISIIIIVSITITIPIIIIIIIIIISLFF